MKRDARLAWAVLLVLGLAALFWGWSRGPALNEKATMAGEVSLDAIGFDQVVAVHEDDPFLRKVGAVAVNWAATNRVGMTFGVLFGAALMTLLALIDLRRLRGRSLGAGVGAGLVGMASGAPLGVCVNCAAPIAQGLAAGGSRLETTLAAMMASPTLNVVALLLLFTLFPFHVAAVKLGLTLVLLLAVLPALARTVLAGERDRSLTHALPSREAGPQPPAWSGGGALDGARWVAHAFLKNGWFVAKTTVPLMLAAGLFGALVVVLLPLDRLPEIVAATSLSEALLWSLALALLGAALPVPITFDVIVCAVLYAAGLPLRFVAVLLFTLGVYSVYSGLVIGRGISKRTALVLFAAVAALGVVAGDVTQAWANAARSSTLAALDTLEGEEPGWAVAPPETRPVELPRPAWEPVAPGVERRAVASLPGAEVDEGFTALDAAALGLETPATLTPLHVEYPFVQGRGRTLAAGDVHGDGLDDLVVVSEAGVVLHENAGGTFGARPLDLPGVPLFAALVDLDADGALDLYVGGLRGDRWLPGDGEGGFGEARELLIDGRWVAAAGFADLDADGDLDAITSRWSPAWRGPWKTAEASSDVLLRNDGAGRFTPEALPSLPGAGTAVLLHDLDADGRLDALVGHDFAPPEGVYRATDEGFERAPALLPATTRDTMGIAAADVDGDLEEELFFVDIAHGHGDDPYTGGRVEVEDACAWIDDPSCAEDARLTRAYLAARRQLDVDACALWPDPNACRAAFFLGTAHRFEGDEACRFPAGWGLYRGLCAQNVQEPFQPSAAARQARPPQRRGGNLLLDRGEDGWREATPPALAHTGWTWQPRFVDVDGDGDQDLFVATGTPSAVARRESNALFLREGEGWEDATERLGLLDRRPTANAVWIDLEGDGDPDLVSLPIHGPLQVRRNDLGGQRLAIGLRDERGGPGVMARVRVETEAGMQLHVVRASGGYLSFDGLTLHVGLGDVSGATRIDVSWPDGTESAYPGPFPAGHRYRLTHPGYAPPASPGPEVHEGGGAAVGDADAGGDAADAGSGGDDAAEATSADADADAAADREADSAPSNPAH